MRLNRQLTATPDAGPAASQLNPGRKLRADQVEFDVGEFVENHDRPCERGLSPEEPEASSFPDTREQRDDTASG